MSRPVGAAGTAEPGGGRAGADRPRRDVPYSCAVLRLVPHPYIGRGAPVGLVLQSRPAEFLGLRAITDADALRALAPDADIGLLVRYLRSAAEVAAGDAAAGEIALLSAPERFHWLTARRSDVIQPDPLEHGTCADPAAKLDALFQARVLGG